MGRWRLAGCGQAEGSHPSAATCGEADSRSAAVGCCTAVLVLLVLHGCVGEGGRWARAKAGAASTTGPLLLLLLPPAAARRVPLPGLVCLPGGLLLLRVWRRRQRRWRRPN